MRQWRVWLAIVLVLLLEAAIAFVVVLFLWLVADLFAACCV